jgi:ActR/RegA family two-component response regulator
MQGGRSVLVVDDERTFDPARLGIGRGGLLVHARTSAEALRRLRQRSWEELWLDHDLDGRDTVIPVVAFLRQAVDDGAAMPLARVVVHTANPSGARAIRIALNPYYRVERLSDVRPFLVSASSARSAPTRGRRTWPVSS